MRRTWSVVLLATLWNTGWSTGWATDAWADEFDVATAYRQACAVCHGADGSGLAPDDPRMATFASPPADFTDPLFNSREPAADWFLVIKYGGASIGLSSQMPSYQGAYSDQQIDALVGFIKTLTDTSAYPPGDLNFPRPFQSIKAFPEDEALILNRYESDDGGEDTLRTQLYFARRLAASHQLEIKATRVDHSDDSGWKDVEVGWKWAFHHDLQRLRLAAGGLEVEIPVDGGDESETWVPYLSLAKGAGDWTFQGTLRSHLPSDDFDDGDVALAAAAHWLPSPWPRGVIPGLEAAAAEPFDSGRDLQASLIPQLIAGISKLGHVKLAVGLEIPVTGLDYDYRVRTFLLWDIADGPFWTGW